VAPGEIGALLRQEGIYSSHLATWRKQRQAAGETSALARKRGPKVDASAVQGRRVLELEKQVERLRAKLVKADLIIAVQKNFPFCWVCAPTTRRASRSDKRRQQLG